MIQVIKIHPVGFAANTYFLTVDGKSVVCIDPAQPRVYREAEKHGLEVKYVLLTHGHFDHIGGCAALQEAGAKIGCLSGEERLAILDNLSDSFGGGLEIAPFSVDFTVRDGEILDICGMKIKVIASAGHTAGGACYLADGCLFTGDTLFRGSVGRCDLPTGNMETLEKSVRRLYALEGDYAVYAGHGEDTTLEEERRNNGVIRA